MSTEELQAVAGKIKTPPHGEEWGVAGRPRISWALFTLSRFSVFTVIRLSDLLDELADVSFHLAPALVPQARIERAAVEGVDDFRDIGFQLGGDFGFGNFSRDSSLAAELLTGELLQTPAYCGNLGFNVGQRDVVEVLSHI